MKKTAVAILIGILAVGLIGGTADGKKKKKKKKINVPVLGVYSGTTNEGGPVQVNVTSKTSGSFVHCSEIIPFTLINKSFTVVSPDPTIGTVNATATFNSKSVLTGTIQPSGCTSSLTTFVLYPPKK